MTDDSKNSPSSENLSKQRARDASTASLAMELPFTLVGAVVFAGVVGYFLDRWLHTRPWLTLILGTLGFIAGLREVLRRLPADTSGPQDGPKST
jgi:ATP synthase protein I